MLNKPKFMSPSTNMQECVVDVESDNGIFFSCIIDGSEAIYAWRIKIYKLSGGSDGNGTMVYKTDKVSLGENPFHPINEKNQNVIFKKNLREYSSVVADTFTNDSEPYYWTIEFWNKNDNENDTDGKSPTVKSCEEVFYANALPDVNLFIEETALTEGYVLGKNKATFKATYKQCNGISLKRYGWRIIDTDNNKELVDTITNNQIYSTSDNIICSYNGFLNDSNYTVELYVETQNGATCIIDPIPFSVSYPTTFLENGFKTEVLRYESGISNSWQDAKTIEGKLVKPYTLINDGIAESKTEVLFDVKDQCISDYPVVGNSSIQIDFGQKVIFDYNSTSNLDVPEDSYIVLSFQIPSGTADSFFEYEIFYAEGTSENGNINTRKLTFMNNTFFYYIETNGNSARASHKTLIDYGDYTWFNVVLCPVSKTEDTYVTDLIVTESSADSGRSPSNTEYPGTNEYPSFGEYVVGGSGIELM